MHKSIAIVPAFITATGLLLLVVVCSIFVNNGLVNAAQESGSVGLEGRISAAPPSVPATISFPRDGQTITDLPVTVTGICTNGLLVKLFKNNVLY